jgi:hypothetical protein
MNVTNLRGNFFNTKKALSNGELHLGFIGGSITDSREKNRWPEPVIAWFCKNYPSLRLFVENAAIGSTGSDLAVFRVDRDLIERNCDLIFIEYAVNDISVPSERRMRSREGLIRKLLKSSKTDLILTYTYIQDMYEDMINEHMPDSITEFELLAEHYNISSVWMGLYALNELRAGQIRWEEWLPDGLHPESRGSCVYAKSVTDFLQIALSDNNVSHANKLPLPLNCNNWEYSYLIPFDKVKLVGPWTIRRMTTIKWIEQVLETSAVGSKMFFKFRGQGLVLGFDFGKCSSEFKYRLDERDWVNVIRDRPYWCGNDGWYRLELIAENLENKIHEIEIVVTHGNRPECTGTNFALGLIGVVIATNK